MSARSERTFFIAALVLYASSRRADIMNYVPTKDVFLYRTHVSFMFLFCLLDAASGCGMTVADCLDWGR